MEAQAYNKPTPDPTPDTKPFWDALKEGRLVLQTCADCGKTAQVPFQPTGSRPVYCNDCFRARR